MKLLPSFHQLLQFCFEKIHMEGWSKVVKTKLFLLTFRADPFATEVPWIASHHRALRWRKDPQNIQQITHMQWTRTVDNVMRSESRSEVKVILVLSKIQLRNNYYGGHLVWEWSQWNRSEKYIILKFSLHRITEWMHLNRTWNSLKLFCGVLSRFLRANLIRSRSLKYTEKQIDMSEKIVHNVFILCCSSQIVLTKKKYGSPTAKKNIIWFSKLVAKIKGYGFFPHFVFYIMDIGVVC